MTGDDTTHGSIVPIRRGVAGVAHDDETRARCFVLYATVAGRNYAAVERLLAEERSGSDLPVPSRSVIQTWGNEDRWAQQADDIWRNTKQWTHEQLQVIALANVLLGQQRRHEVLQGKLEGNNDLAAQYLKAGELSDRFVERVLPIKSMRPPEVERNEEDMTKEEREHLAANRIARKRKEESA